jgi:hypothetical protein
MDMSLQYCSRSFLPAILGVALAGTIVLPSHSEDFDKFGGVPIDAETKLPAPNLTAGGNRWRAYIFNDSSSSHTALTWGPNQSAYNVYCFYYAGITGTHRRYKYTSALFPTLAGEARQEGDQIKMFADFSHGIGHETASWELMAGPTQFAKAGGGGHYIVWTENGTFPPAFANLVMVRDGSCKSHVVIDDLLDEASPINGNIPIEAD